MSTLEPMRISLVRPADALDSPPNLPRAATSSTNRADMSYANEIRTRVAYASAAIGVLLLLPSVFFDSAWSAYGSMLGGVLLLMGLLMCSSLSLLNGIPWLLKLGARHAEPVWEGNFIRTEGGQFRIRYVFNNKRSPWFIAQ